ncbi:hypothetical protein [Pseudoalteromonas sp.]|uniref:hypothetical protein n=1 Tax=Pseudoalteromonas sp. TaxID=53249 RepID=UPI002610A9DC|nr:hypothetical protein [Pseudoalteromonas sp.]MCP4585330.1 hypothetical protein [Pseudoalteromonas sp.]
MMTNNKKKTPVKKIEKKQAFTPIVEESVKIVDQTKVVEEPKVINLTPEEQAIAARVGKEQESWDSITEESMLDFSLAKNPYPLPKEAEKRRKSKEHAFRFIECKPSRIDEITNLEPPAKWWIANRTTTPYLAKYIDPAHGGIQIKDQILMVKPWKMEQIHQDAKKQIAKGKDDSGNIENRDGLKTDKGEYTAKVTKDGERNEAKISGGDIVMAEA